MTTASGAGAAALVGAAAAGPSPGGPAPLAGGPASLAGTAPGGTPPAAPSAGAAALGAAGAAALGAAGAAGGSAVAAQAAAPPAAAGWWARRRRPVALVGMLVALALLFLAALAIGAVAVPLDETVRVVLGADPHDPRWSVVVGQIRLPRALTAMLAGAALSVAGLQMQTLFRNPLADPYSLGVSSGASLGVALVVAGIGGTGSTFTAGVTGTGRLGVVAAGATGAAIVLAAVLTLARWVRSVVTLLVIGIVLSSAVSSVVSLLLTWTAPARAVQYWTWALGSFSGTTTRDLVVLGPVVGVGLLLALVSVKQLNALLLGENYARTMGLHLRRTRTLALFGAAVLAGSVTAFCGPIAFLGIAVPHVARRLLGTSDHRVLVPGTLLTGASLALACSIVAQLPGTGLVLPINVVTALLGTPIVIGVLLRARASVTGAS